MTLSPTASPETTEEQLVYASEVVRIGFFRARPEDRHFRFSGLPGEALFCFPRTSVWIERDDAEPFVADRTLVTWYDPEDVYYRRPISSQGDHGDWWAISPELLERALGDAGLSPRPEAGRFFPFHRTASRPGAYLFQRRLTALLENPGDFDPMAVDEGALILLEDLLEPFVADRAERLRSVGGRPQDRELAERAREVLAARYADSLTLTDLAGELGVSSSHLSRVFRRVTGHTLHRYRSQLRLRRAVHRLLDAGPVGSQDLTELALDLGYSSHSHFTAAFRRSFGAPPSTVRAGGGPSRNLIAATRGRA